MTKADLEKRVKELEGKLEERVYALEATLKAIGSRFIKADGNKYIALPLTDEETYAVKETLSDMCCERFDGSSGILSGSYESGEAEFQDVITNADVSWRHGNLLPQWDGYVVRYSWTTNDGTYAHSFWGMKLAK